MLCLPMEEVQDVDEALVSIPDVLGEEGRAEMVANMLLDFQRQLFRLDLMQAANAHSDRDPVPGMDPPVSYSDRRVKLGEGVDAITKGFSDLMPKLEKMLDRNGQG